MRRATPRLKRNATPFFVSGPLRRYYAKKIAGRVLSTAIALVLPPPLRFVFNLSVFSLKTLKKIKKSRVKHSVLKVRRNKIKRQQLRARLGSEHPTPQA